MNKLTAEKCREMLTHFKSLNIQGYLLEEGKQILQALEIALPVLEQQESPTDTYRQIENDSWIEWGGGNCPVRVENIVDVRFQDGSVSKNNFAGELLWSRSPLGDHAPYDIIAYRVIENDGREG